MKRLALILVLLAPLTASAAQIWTVNSVADPADPMPLLWLNASTINTNAYAAYGETWGDGRGGLWTFHRADATATNTVAAGGPLESLNPLSPAGRWVLTMAQANSGGGTNYFNTLIVTNLYITTNVYVINGGGTNAEGLWILDTGTLRPVNTDLDKVYVTATNGLTSEYKSTSTLPNVARFLNGVTNANAGVAAVWQSWDSTTAIQSLAAIDSQKLGWWNGADTTTFDSNLRLQISRGSVGGLFDLLELRGDDLSVRLGSSGKFIFGPGTTNVLYRSGSDLEYTNGVTTGVSLRVKDGGANTATFGTDSGGNVLVTGGSGKTVKLGPDNGVELYFASSTAFYPNSTNLNLGFLGAATRWGDLLQAGHHKLYGELSGVGLTNYSLCTAFVTNGVMVFDFQNGGTGTPLSKFSFMSNGVEVGHFP